MAGVDRELTRLEPRPLTHDSGETFPADRLVAGPIWGLACWRKGSADRKAIFIGYRRRVLPERAEGGRTSAFRQAVADDCF